MMAGQTMSPGEKVWPIPSKKNFHLLHLCCARHYGAVLKPCGLGGKATFHGIDSNCHGTSNLGGFLRTSWKIFRTQGLHMGGSGRIGLANGIRFLENKNNCHPERVLLGLSQIGRQTLVDTRQIVRRVAGESFTAVRVDVMTQGRRAWQLLVERGYLHTGEKAIFPQLGKVLKSASLTCVRSQVVPRTLAVFVGYATLLNQSVAESVPLPGVSGLHREGITAADFLMSLYLSLPEGLMVILRAVYLAALFAPVLAMAPFVHMFGDQFREAWYELIHHTLELAGAAFIKWGQWAATRPDIFPRDLCFHLSKLHSKAPTHDFAQTRRIIEGAFERKLDDIFEEFERVPMASGSIGQVHKAVLRFKHPGQNSKPLTVAVKVRHPGVSEVIRRDFSIINWVAKLSTCIPGLSWLRLDETVQQFAVFMLSQVDLAREAAHLSRFNHNFRKWKDVSFPKPLYPLVHPEVLVETFEQGKSVAHYVDLPETTPLNKGLADIGTNTLLKMLLVDNFIHADLHPGNILVQANDFRGKQLFKSRPHLILLDVGMTVELSQKDQQTLLNFFKAIAINKGRTVAECALQFTRAQKCPNPEAFKDAVEDVFEQFPKKAEQGVHAGECILELLEKVREHKVNIDGDICSVIVTTLVLEGWQRKLNPELNMIDTMQTLLFQSDWASSLSYTLDVLMGP